jgi:hypothetical protein
MVAVLCLACCVCKAQEPAQKGQEKGQQDPLVNGKKPDERRSEENSRQIRQDAKSGYSTGGVAAKADRPHIDDPSALRITLKAPVSERTSDAFLQTLSTFIGAEIVSAVDVPKSDRTLAAGSWSAAEVLAYLAGSFAKAKPVQGMWQRVYVIKPAQRTLSGEKPGEKSAEKTADCKLASAGKVSVNLSDRSLQDIAETIGRSVKAEVKLDAAVTGRFSLKLDSTPAEKALETVASRAGLVVSQRMVFRFYRQTDLAAMDPEDAAAMAEAEETSDEILFELDTLSFLTDALGADPESADFPWETVAPTVWERIGFNGERLAQFRQSISERIENRAATEKASLDALSGRTPIGNIDPTTGEVLPEGPGDGPPP